MIYRTLDRGKELFKSDQKYLDEKLEFKEKKFAQVITNIADELESPTQQQIMQEASEVVNLREKLNRANDKILNLEKTISEKKTEQKQVEKKIEQTKKEQKEIETHQDIPTPEKPKLRGSMPKDWKPTKEIKDNLETFN